MTASLGIDKHYWWQAQGSEMVGRIWTHLENLGQWRDERVVEVAWLMAAYEREGWAAREVAYNGRGRGTITDAAGIRSKHFDFIENVAPSINLVADNVNTVGARLFSDPPAIEVRAYNANYDRERQAQRLTDALNGVMNNDSAAQQLEIAGFDGLKCGFGAIRPVVTRGKLRYERILYRQLWWDPEDAQWGSPQNLHYWQRVSRSRLQAHVEQMDDSLFKGKDRASKAAVLEMIKTAPEADPWGPYQHQGAGWASIYESAVIRGGLRQGADQLHVVHSWHLPGGEDSEDGRYVITMHTGGGQSRDHTQSDTGLPKVSYQRGRGELFESASGNQTGVVIYDGKWTRQTFPIVWWTPYPDSEGIDGSGIGTLTRPYQEIVDRTYSKFQDSFDSMSHTKVLVWPKSAPDKQDIAAQGVTFVNMPMDGGNPGFQVVSQNSVISDQEFQYFQWVVSSSKQYLGINEGMAMGGTRLGANASGVALMEEDDRSMDRLSIIERQWNCFRLSVARETLNALDEAVLSAPDFFAAYEADGMAHRKKWVDLQMDHEDYHIGLEAVGMLGRRKAGRIQKLVEFSQQQVIDPSLAGEELLGSADMRRVSRIERAGKKLVEYQLSVIADLSRPATDGYPTEHTDLSWADKLSLVEIQEAERRNASVEVLNRLMDYRSEVQRRIQEQAPPPMPGPIAPGALPGMDAPGGELPAEMAPVPIDAPMEIM